MRNCAKKKIKKNARIPTKTQKNKQKKGGEIVIHSKKDKNEIFETIKSDNNNWKWVIFDSEMKYEHKPLILGNKFVFVFDAFVR